MAFTIGGLAAFSAQMLMCLFSSPKKWSPRLRSLSKVTLMHMLMCILLACTSAGINAYYSEN